MRRVTPRSRAAWRRWLAQYHTSADEVWLVFYKKHTGKPTLSYNDAVEEALCFGWIDGIRKSIDDERYMHRFSPRLPTSNWSASNRKRVERLIAGNLMTPAGRRLVDHAKRSGTWDRDSAPRQFRELPEEFAAALRADRKASGYFDSLAPSYRRQYAGWIGSAKRPETRERRIREALDLLRQGQKLGMR